MVERRFGVGCQVVNPGTETNRIKISLTTYYPKLMLAFDNNVLILMQLLTLYGRLIIERVYLDIGNYSRNNSSLSTSLAIGK